MPNRVQRKRTKGWVLPENTVCVDRSSGFGNPFKITRFTDLTTNKDWWFVENSLYAWRFETKDDAALAAVKLFRRYATDPANRLSADVYKLRGKNLACFCKLDQPCHADVLLELANR
jgi:uncharacterized protein DUF4326